MDASRLADHLCNIRDLLCRLPADQPSRLVSSNDSFLLLIDSTDALQALRAMFPSGTPATHTRPGTWQVRWGGIVVLVQEPLSEPAPEVKEIKL